MNSQFHTVGRLLSALVCSTIGMAVSNSAHGAAITWGDPINISGDSDVSKAGNLVGAYSFGIISFNPTVNGVTFINPGGYRSFAVSFGNFSLTLNSSPLSGDGFLGTLGNTTLDPFASLSANYKNLNRESIGGSAGTVTLTIGSLSVGELYEFQWWSSVPGGGFTSRTTATAGNAVTLIPNVPPSKEGGLGQFAVGTFIADSTTQLIQYSGDWVVINALQLRSLGAAGVPDSGNPMAMLVGAMVGLYVMSVRVRRSPPLE